MPDVTHDHFGQYNKRWDRYQRFHAEPHHGFVVFDTGEVICTQKRFSPDERGYPRYFNRSVSIVASHDKAALFGKLYTSKKAGVRIPKSWLLDGMYLLDHEQGQLVLLRRYSSSGEVTDGHNPLLKHVSVNMRSAGFTAYCGGKGNDWVGVDPVTWLHPIPIGKEFRQHLRGLEMQAKAALRVGVITEKLWQVEYTDVDRSRNVTASITGLRPNPIYRQLEFKDLTDMEKTNIAHHGWGAPTTYKALPSLWIREN